jgi:hypothetical protein
MVYKCKEKRVNRANITIAIDRLVIRGLPVARHQYPQLQATVEAELARLLVAHGLAPQLMQGASMRSLAGGTLQLAEHIDPDDLGQHIAEAVFHGIGGERR